jgi:hypothetical protein
MQLFFVFVQYRTLGRLRRRLRKLYPGALQKLWTELSVTQRIEIVASPAVFTVISVRMMLLDLFVVRQRDIPPEWMADDAVANLVFRLNQHWSASAYRKISRLSGNR